MEKEKPEALGAQFRPRIRHRLLGAAAGGTGGLRFVLSDLGWEGYLGFVEDGMDNLHIGCSPGSREFFAKVFEETLGKVDIDASAQN